MRLMVGIAATQRGRAVQPAFMMSSNNSAVVAGSTVTSLNSGGGGATAVLQSEITSATDGDARKAAMIAPPMAAKRDGVMMGSGGCGKQRKIEQGRRSGYGPLPAIRMRAAGRADRLTGVTDDRRRGAIGRRMSARAMLVAADAVIVVLRTIAAESAIFVMLDILVSPA